MALDNVRNNFDKKFVCIHYPGIVNNVDKALDTLGGINQISKVYSSSRRLELRFRPDDPYCKPAFSNKHSITGILLKVRVKKNKTTSTTRIVSTEVAGVVETIYKFETLSDFQYLPLVQKNKSTSGQPQLKCILKEVIPEGMLGVEWFNIANQYFLVPPLFSRIDTPQNYAFRSNTTESNVEHINSNFVTHSRKKRYSYAADMAFNHVDPTPIKPKKNAEVLLQTVPKEALEKVKQLFEEKPIWSKVGLQCVSKLSSAVLKGILPNLAYYYTSGPWRILWIKFGYDPRKEPESRIYQHIDFRVRNTGGLKTLIKSSRSENPLLLPSKQTSIRMTKNDNIDNKEELSKSSYIFTAEELPQQLQTFYQYCNINVPEIKELLSDLGEVLPGALCHEKRGWMPIGFDEKCREIMNNYVTEKMKSTYNYPGASINDDEFSDVGNDNLNVEIADIAALSEYEYEVEFENIDPKMD